jgi:hypothetical protein
MVIFNSYVKLLEDPEGMFNGMPNQRGRFWFVISFAPRFTHFSPLWHFTQDESQMDLSEIWGHSKIKY